MYVFVFHCNNGPILYRFRYKEIYWSTIAIFNITRTFDAQVKGEMNYQKMKKV